MDKIRGVLAVLKTKSGRKLTIVSAILTIALLVVALAGSFFISVLNEIVVLESSVRSIPALMKERGEQTQSQYDVYTNDYRARGELATLLYNNYEHYEGEEAEGAEVGKTVEATDVAERLESIKSYVGALDITVLDSDGKLVASTSDGQPSAAVMAAFAAIDDDPEQLYDPNLSGFNDEAMNDEDGYVPETDSMPMVYDGHPRDGNILMLEFDYTNFGQILAKQNSFDGICERVLAGMEGYAFVMDKNEDVGGYPLDDMSDEDVERLSKEVVAAFNSEGALVDNENEDGSKTVYAISDFLGHAHLLVKLTTPEMDYAFMLAIPVSSFAGTMVWSDIAIIVLVIVGYVLFCRYAIKSFRTNHIKAENDKQRRRIARKRTFAGIGVMLGVTAALACMLLMLEGMSNTARFTITQQETIEYETEYRQARKKSINEEYSERYCIRALAIANMLTTHPEMRTRERLQEFNRVSQTEYLMLFDKDGKELFSSNGYTGFSVGDESTGAKPEWKPILQGYAQVETPTEKNEVTGTYERTIATLITDESGLPDGFLVMVVNDDAYKKEIGDASLKGTVKSFTPRKGQMVAVVDNETGEFTAHTNEEMVGEKASNYLDEGVLGRDYEGYTSYDGSSVYVSGVSNGGETTLVITNSRSTDTITVINWYLVGFMLLLILLFFYPAAASLCAKYVRETIPEKKSRDKSHPMMIFFHGYVAYIAVLAIASLLGVVFEFWSAFEFVWSGKWTPGIHLFAIWNALFTFAILSYITTWLHRLIAHIGEQVNTHTRTFARLADSLITYAISIVMVILILHDLGVDTATIIGSVSIVSIAIGMGTQDLVKDIVAGLFLIFEGTIAVGDIVEIGGWHGRVTDMGIRTTEITNDHNDVKILTNSKIGDVVNLSKVKTACTEEFTIPRKVEIDALPELVASYIETVVEDIPEIRESLQLDEITSITENSYTVRLSYLVNEADRESATIRLRNGMLLLLENK